MDKILTADQAQRPPKSNHQSRLANGALIRTLREARGLTQVDLARLSGYSERLIRKAESGGSIRIETFENLAAALSSTGETISFSDLIANQIAVGSGFSEIDQQQPDDHLTPTAMEPAVMQVSHTSS